MEVLYLQVMLDIPIDLVDVVVPTVPQVVVMVVPNMIIIEVVQLVFLFSIWKKA